MSVQSEITRLENAKSDIATAITNKGVTVPSGTKLDGMAVLIGSIESGGSGVTTNEVELKFSNYCGKDIVIVHRPYGSDGEITPLKNGSSATILHCLDTELVIST